MITAAPTPIAGRIMSWKTLSSQTKYDNPWMTVYEDDVINPGGGRNAYGWVHFKNRAIAIVPIDDDGNTWLIGQQRFTLGDYSWELPMGGGPLDEAALDAAVRELKEETGLSAERWTELMKVHTSNSITDEEGFVFVAEGLSQGETDFEEMEDLAIRKLPLSEAVQMVTDGEITDVITIAALLRVHSLRAAS
ncbi:MAG: NUDIX hydrolase [Pseudomonadota bacterium]